MFTYPISTEKQLESNHILWVYQCTSDLFLLFVLFALKQHNGTETVQWIYETSGFPLTLTAKTGKKLHVDVCCLDPNVLLLFELSEIHTLSRFTINVNVVEKNFLV